MVETNDEPITQVAIQAAVDIYRTLSATNHVLIVIINYGSYYLQDAILLNICGIRIKKKEIKFKYTNSANEIISTGIYVIY